MHVIYEKEDATSCLRTNLIFTVDDEPIWALRMLDPHGDLSSDGFCDSTHNSKGHVLVVFQEATLELHVAHRQGFPVVVPI